MPESCEHFQYVIDQPIVNRYCSPARAWSLSSDLIYRLLRLPVNSLKPINGYGSHGSYYWETIALVLFYLLPIWVVLRVLSVLDTYHHIFAVHLSGCCIGVQTIGSLLSPYQKQKRIRCICILGDWCSVSKTNSTEYHPDIYMSGKSSLVNFVVQVPLVTMMPSELNNVVYSSVICPPS